MKAEQLEDAFEVHRYYKASDKDAMLADVGDKIEFVGCGGHGIRIDAALIDKLPKARIIANFGVGYDMVDTAKAAERGIKGIFPGFFVKIKHFPGPGTVLSKFPDFSRFPGPVGTLCILV